MNIRRERVVAPEVVLTGVAVCFVPLAGWFVVQGTVRVITARGESITDIVSSPLTRRQLEAESDGPELAEFLMAYPGRWWRLPLPGTVAEGRGV